MALPDPITLACSAQDSSRWVLAALGIATAVQVALYLAFVPRRRAQG